VNLLDRVRIDEELLLILPTIGCGKHKGGDQMTQVIDGQLCNPANGNASIPRLTYQHDA
jgi:protein involved in ribonucleotide reduction